MHALRTILHLMHAYGNSTSSSSYYLQYGSRRQRRGRAKKKGVCLRSIRKRHFYSNKTTIPFVQKISCSLQSVCPCPLPSCPEKPSVEQRWLELQLATPFAKETRLLDRLKPLGTMPDSGEEEVETPPLQRSSVARALLTVRKGTR